MLSRATPGHPYPIFFPFILSFAYLATVYPRGIILVASISDALLQYTMPLLCEARPVTSRYTDAFMYKLFLAVQCNAVFTIEFLT